MSSQSFSRRSLFRTALGAAGASALSRSGLASSQPVPVLSGPGFDPARTWVFGVGILSWRDSAEYASFPTAGRKDAELMAAFRSAGVPADHVDFVTDARATRAAIVARLDALLARTRPGDFLWFYYAGHGVIEEGAGMHLVPHDTDHTRVVQTGLALRAVVDAIDRRFAGRAVLTADCCHSGAMVTEIARRNGPVSYAAVASSLSSEESTGNWTFTECLLDGLRGAGVADTDRDGVVRLEDLARYAEARMAFEEEQLSSFGVGAGFDRTLALARATPLRDPRVGAQVEVSWQGRYYKARVLDVRPDGAQRVHYAGFPASDDEWATPDRVRPFTPRVYPVGIAVQAEWHGRWWPARIIDARLGLHQVHYDNFNDEWNEWVSSRRLRVPGAAPAAPARARPARNG